MHYNFRAYLPYYKRNLKVAVPVMLTQFGASLVGLFDSIMVGHYGTVDLAAVSFSNAIFFTVMVFAMGSIMGITPLVGIEVGRNDADSPRKIAAYLQNGFHFTLLLVSIMLFLLGGCIPLLGYFGQDPEVVEAARPYYIYIVLSLIPHLFFCLQKQFLEGLGNTFIAMLITLGANLLNILLNWIFIFGHWGAPEMGAAGAGLASLIARSITPFCFLAVIVAKKEWRRYLSLFSRTLNSWQEIRKLFRIGLPIGSRALLETFVFTISFIFIGWISKEALAAHQIANQIATMTFMLSQGIGAAATIRVSHQLGTGDIRAVRMASNASVHLCLLMSTIGATLMICFHNVIPYIFTADPIAIHIAQPLILIAGLWQYSDGLQCVGAAMLQGITDVKRPMIYAFITYILITLPLCVVLTFPLGLGVIGMWIGFIIGLTVAAFLFHIRYRKLLRNLEKASISTEI